MVTFKGLLEGKKENSFIDAPDSPLQGYGTEEKVLLWEGDRLHVAAGIVSSGAVAEKRVSYLSTQNQ